MEISEKIADHFAGIVTHKISISEQNKFNILLRKVRTKRTSLIRYEAKKIVEKYNENKTKLYRVR